MRRVFMRALVFHQNTLTLEQSYQKPDPQPGEALIRVLLTGICNTDIEITRGYMAFEGILGHEFVGIVEAVHEGPGASTLHSLVGKRVVGEINAACHPPNWYYCQRVISTHCPNRTTLGIVNRDGAFAEYLTLPLENLHVVPDTVSDEEAVFVKPLAANFDIIVHGQRKPSR